MAVIGHNSGSLTSAAEANVETGIWLLAKEFLVTAIQDRRLERGHLRVLACFAQCINKTSGKAWPDRVSIAAMSGMNLKAVSNAISELKRFGYLIAGREPVDMAGGQVLTVYTFGNIDHETVRREITAFVEGLKSRRDASHSSPYTGKSISPLEGNFPAHGDAESPPTGNVPADGEENAPHTGNDEVESSPYAGTSNYRDNNKPTTKRTKSERGTRLPDDWFLPKPWGEWVVQTFEVTPFKVRAEAERFKNYWLAKSSNATKRDWYRTWQNWCLDERKGWKRKTTLDEHAPDLVAAMTPSESDVHDEWEAARRITEALDD